jgi:Oxidoreductase family, NAD-binding Rossmann fold
MTSFAFILGCVPLWTASGLGRGRPPAYGPCSRMPEVGVVAICSPGQFHAAQVEAATAAGKRGILCEKPLATTVEEAQLIADNRQIAFLPGSLPRTADGPFIGHGAFLAQKASPSLIRKAHSCVSIRRCRIFDCFRVSG